MGIREGGRVRAVVVGDRLIIEPLPSVEDMIREPVAEITAREAEKLSEEA